MEIKVADQRILLFEDLVSPEDAQKKSWEKKLDAFGTVSKVSSFLSRPKDEDFELIYKEHRYQPFWHVVAKARYVYERSCVYQVGVSAKEVKEVTLQEKKYAVTNGHLHLTVLEHCVQDEQEEIFVDGVTGKTQPDLSKYLKTSPKVVTGQIKSLVPKDSILVPPSARISAIMRDALAKMIKGIQADKILEERVEVTSADLYYRPVYAFQYKWKSKNKEAIVEEDGITGEVESGNRIFKEYLGYVLDRNFLFDIGADAAGMFIPGGSLAVKAVKRYIDIKK